MKRLFIAMLLGISFVFVGCTNTNEIKGDNTDTVVSEQGKETIDNAQETKKSEDKTNEDDPVVNEKKYIENGEAFVAKDERGTYELKIIDAIYLGAHSGDSGGNLRLQLVWDVNNISFNGQAQDFNGNIIEEGIVGITPESLKVKDDNGYILSMMSSGWEGDWANQDIAVKIGEKAIQKFTWVLNSEDSEYVYVSYPRMENIEFKVKINK